ncbi:FAD-dependent oxidoreductase [Rhodococcus sp. WS1]|jgi:NADPH-dependent 2,4-dienoyl-CoA reductase/sulfur reductase-like enzyme|uniref:Pyridine nucleotide-disulfide oxidoreductase n=1 Tax=Rhodococcus erythropolis TaxID=1833 RepID=A0A6G9CM77_RHOER|nr:MULTISPECIES: FAD-dependent oxidoreductase [Rhodococcus]MCJ0896709.1 FAD-dependent oxidoreductase [Rhodococcus sp. ARC_M13]MDV6206831.1 FAD-dependent oxidoreductase [Rhodococcus erythropolis]MQP36274.1 FAD-dependent oxidoreductase [Rhodococcus erythropolis]QIP38135.1 pyridine nucleotide-disulfide oxidoreductase [Rhodococcus erythropolis]ROZ60461.1 FAD-dependent oxidoreductase [Rhodococcus sp. WS1]
MTAVSEPDTRTVVIVGTGIAGSGAAQALRKEGFGGSIILIGSEAEEPYRRPALSKELLSGKASIDRVRLRPPTFWTEQGIDLRIGVTSTSIDTDSRTVCLVDGDSIDYDVLILATGGRPRRLTAEDSERVHYLRDIADMRRLQSQLIEGSSLLVVGGGLIGSEVASTARDLGCSVQVLEAQPLPLSRLLPPSIAEKIAALHNLAGVALQTGVDLEALTTGVDGVTARARDGREWTADLAVVAIGSLPDTDMAAAAGIAVDNGISVDRYLRTSVIDVYAIGDVANVPNGFLGGMHRGEHWNTAQDHAVAVAKTIVGKEEPFESVPWSWSNQFGRNIQVAGWPGADDTVIVRGDLDSYDFTAICMRDGNIVGAVSVGRPKDIRAVRTLIERSPDISADVLADSNRDLTELAAGLVASPVL